MGCDTPKILTEEKAKAILRAIKFKELVLDKLDSYEAHNDEDKKMLSKVLPTIKKEYEKKLIENMIILNNGTTSKDDILYDVSMSISRTSNTISLSQAIKRIKNFRSSKCGIQIFNQLFINNICNNYVSTFKMYESLDREPDENEKKAIESKIKQAYIEIASVLLGGPESSGLYGITEANYEEGNIKGIVQGIQQRTSDQCNDIPVIESPEKKTRGGTRRRRRRTTKKRKV
jgi:hypothetical protein